MCSFQRQNLHEIADFILRIKSAILTEFWRQTLQLNLIFLLQHFDGSFWNFGHISEAKKVPKSENSFLE
jgi:hypothetical protein